MVATATTATTTTLTGIPQDGQRRFFAIRENVAVPTIHNPSFEVDTFNVWPGYIGGNGAINGWTGNPPTGLNPAAGQSPFADNGSVPNGSKVAFIQSGGSAEQILSTTITGLTPGVLYEVSFQANSRAATAAPSAAWSLNKGAFVPFTASPAVGGSNPYYTVTGTFIAKEATASLSIRNKTNHDSAVLIDDFRILAR